MAPKFKFTKEEITTAALDIARESGPEAVTARAVGCRLGSSSKVIFGLFRNMEELTDAVKTAAFQCYLQYLEEAVSSGQYPPYKASGMGYIRFAAEEKELFKMLFMCDRRGGDELDRVKEESVEPILRTIMEANGITRSQAEMLHLEMWICVHGIAAMLATSYLRLDWELISQILTDTYLGVRDRLLSGKE